MSLQVNESLFTNSFSYFNNISKLYSKKTFPANKTDFTSSFKKFFEFVNSNENSSSDTYDYYNSSNSKFIKNYTNLFTNFKELSSNINLNNKNGIWNNKLITSSDNNILTAKSLFKLDDSSNFTVNIKTVASKQSNTSNFINKTDKTKFTSYNITLNKGDESSTFSIYADEEDDNQTVMEKLMAVINTSNDGVYAEIVENEEEQISLSISSDFTGQAENFTLQADENLSSILNINDNIRQAKDAEYAVTNKLTNVTENFTSASNDIDIDSYRISGTIKKTGSVTVTANVDKEKLYKNLDNIVSAYNKTLDFLDENYEMGNGVRENLNSFTEIFYMKDELNSIGISFDDKGYMKISREDFDQAFYKDLESLKDVVSGRNGFFSNLDKKINQALTTSSFSLIDDSLLTNHNSQLANYEDSKSNNLLEQMNFLGLYISNGSVGIVNYAAIGLLLNTYV